jgi:alkanesulfonate monooxygenase SsuD/methylene tetrahydromethanopterin reductase-like flavin-dependent oxidoreductase (luciferase family)
MPAIVHQSPGATQGPASAAAWAGSALTFPDYSAKTAVWVLGNEGYGPWENDQHPDPHTPKSFPLFGCELDDYDRLYADKLGLLLAINDSPQASWESPFRPPLKDALVVPRPDTPVPIWLGTGGNPGSTVRAGQAGLPVSYGILSGTPQHWGQMGALYREAARQAGSDESRLAVSVAGHGFIGRDGQEAKALFFRHEQAAYAAFGRFAARSWPDAAPNYSPGGMVFAGHPEEIAERIIDLHRHLGHRRHFLQMDIGGMPHAEVLASVELLGTEVAPRVRAELNREP